MLILAGSVVACEPSAPAEYALSSLEITPPEIAVGETVSVSAQVENIGGTEGTYSVSLTIDGVKVQTKVVKVAPRRTETVTFTVVGNEPTTYEVEVNELSGTLRVVKAAEFVVSNLVINPPIAEVGEMVTVAADVTNAGEVEGKYSAVLTVDGSQVEAKELVVAPGATETVSFAFTEGATGSYSIKLGDLSGFVVVTETGDALAELAVAYPELCEELLKLPDLEEIDEKDKEAIQDIAELALKPLFRSAFESMLDEGVKDKRKYCAPLEALLWVAYDRELDGYYPLRPYNLGRLINDAWKHTSTSENYKSDRWKFDSATERLNFPEAISIYVMDNISYDHAMMEEVRITKDWPSPKSPRETYEIGKGVCYEQARLELKWLLDGGYIYNDFEGNKSEAACTLFAREPDDEFRGHHVCLYIDGGRFYMMNSELNGGIEGPFKSVEEAADNTWWGWKQYQFQHVDGHITKAVNR